MSFCHGWLSQTFWGVRTYTGCLVSCSASSFINPLPHHDELKIYINIFSIKIFVLIYLNPQKHLKSKFFCFSASSHTHRQYVQSCATQRRLWPIWYAKCEFYKLTRKLRNEILFLSFPFMATTPNSSWGWTREDCRLCTR